MKKLLSTFAIITLATLPTLANARVVTPQQLGLNLLVNGILGGLGWVMEEGTKTNRIPDIPSGGSSSSGDSSATGSTSVPNPFHVDGEGGEGGTPSEAQTYPFEYWFDGQKFGSAESACEYAFGSYLSQKGLKKSRRQDGTYYERTNIYIGKSGSYHHTVPGYFACSVQAVGIDNKTCPASNVCGSVYTWSGNMLYSGTEKTTHTEVSDDYKERREKARQAVEQAIANAQAQVNAQSGTTTAPSDTTDNPKAGTGVGTGTTTTTTPSDTTTDNTLANPVHADTGTGTTTGDTTTTNTTTTTTTTTTNIKTEVKPFEMPTFCTWAQVVCNFISDDVDTTPKPPTKPNDLNLDNNFKMYINFTGSCPANKPITFTLLSKSMSKDFSYVPFCELLEKISVFLVGFTYLAVATLILKSI